MEVAAATAVRLDTAYEGRDNLHAMQAARRYNDWLVGLVVRHAPSAGHVLDFGAGLGDFADRVRAAGLDVACLEVDAAFASDLRSRGYDVAESIEAFPQGAFDFAYSLNVIEHIDDDVAALRELRARMKPGARFFVYVPAFPILYSNMDRRIGHRRRYTRGSLERSLGAAGFRVEGSRYADTLGFPASLAYRLLGCSGEVDARSVAAYDRFAFPISRKLDRLSGRLLGKNAFATAIA
jgi:SAM-dependent methyltransferase